MKCNATWYERRSSRLAYTACLEVISWCPHLCPPTPPRHISPSSPKRRVVWPGLLVGTWLCAEMCSWGRPRCFQGPKKCFTPFSQGRLALNSTWNSSHCEMKVECFFFCLFFVLTGTVWLMEKKNVANKKQYCWKKKQVRNVCFLASSSRRQSGKKKKRIINSTGKISSRSCWERGICIIKNCRDTAS